MKESSKMLAFVALFGFLACEPEESETGPAPVDNSFVCKFGEECLPDQFCYVKPLDGGGMLLCVNGVFDSTCAEGYYCTNSDLTPDLYPRCLGKDGFIYECDLESNTLRPEEADAGVDVDAG